MLYRSTQWVLKDGIELIDSRETEVNILVGYYNPFFNLEIQKSPLASHRISMTRQLVSSQCFVDYLFFIRHVIGTGSVEAL